MGQAGSVEQRSAIRAVVSIRPGDADKQQILDALRAFSAAFPLEVVALRRILFLKVAQPHRYLLSAQSVQDARDADADGPVAGPLGVDVKERRLFDAVHALLQEQAERTERGSNEELVSPVADAQFVRYGRSLIVLWAVGVDGAAACELQAHHPVAGDVPPVRQMRDEALPELLGELEGRS